MAFETLRQARVGARTVDRAEFSAGLRAHMLRVYNYMASGLALTGIFAVIVFQMSVVTGSGGEIVGLTALGQTLFATPLKWVVLLAPLALVFFLSARIHAMKASTAQGVFWFYAALMGMSLATIFMVYTTESIARVFFIAAASFAGLSLWGYTTNRDLSGWGSFLIMGVIGIVIAAVVNMFIGSTALQFAISVIGVLVFAGLTAYDTQNIKNEYADRHDSESRDKLAVYGALRLYLDFINLFIMLLHLFGARR